MNTSAIVHKPNTAEIQLSLIAPNVWWSLGISSCWASHSCTALPRLCSWSFIHMMWPVDISFRTASSPQLNKAGGAEVIILTKYSLPSPQSLMHPTPKLAYWLLFLSLCWDTWQTQAREECAFACRLKMHRDWECECKAPGVGGSRLQVTRVRCRTDKAGALLPVFFLVSLRSLSPLCAIACLQGGSLWSHVSVNTLTNMPKGVFIPNSVKFITQTHLALMWECHIVWCGSTHL